MKYKKYTLALMLRVLSMYRLRTVLVLFSQLLAASLEGFGIALLVPVLSVLFPGQGETSPMAAKIMAVVAKMGIEPSIGPLLTFLVVVFLLKSILLFAASIQIGYAAAHVANDLRLRLIRSLMGAKWNYFVSNASGHLAYALTTESEMASTTYVTTCQLLAAVIHLAVYCVTACLISWKVTVLALATGALGFMLLGGFINMARVAGGMQVELFNTVCSRLIDGLQGMKTLKAMGSEDRLGPMLERETRGLMAVQRKHVVSKLGLTTFQEPLVVLMLAIGLFVARDHIATNFEQTSVFIFLFWRTVWNVHKLQQFYHKIAGAERAYLSLDEKIEEATHQRETIGGSKAATFEKGVDFKDVSFSYGRTQVLREVDLTIPKGSFVSITGLSGAGKTTFIDLIAGLIEPDSGKIFIDGVELADLDITRWRNSIGYVQQETILFHETIAHNITLGEKRFTEEEVVEALKMAGAWSFIGENPEGINSVVGERGGKLSGGQRQRLALARVLLRKPKLLLLDEITSALDPETEREICELIASLKGQVTIIAISHQKTMTEFADEIYSLANEQLQKV